MSDQNRAAPNSLLITHYSSLITSMKRSTSAVLLVLVIFFFLVALNFLFFVDTRTAQEDEQTGNAMTYTLVSSTEGAPGEGRLSMDSPVAGALIGRRAGDTAVVQTPRGERRFKVLAVR